MEQIEKFATSGAWSAGTAGPWRKMQGAATIRLANGRIRRAELHWYEARGIGKKEFKRNRYLS